VKEAAVTSMNIATRTFGDARATAIQTGCVRFAPHYPPEPDWQTEDTVVDEDGRAFMGVIPLVIQRNGRTVVVDPSTFRPDETTIGGGSILEPGPSLDSSLEEIGIPATDVDLVLITHGHDDHFVGIVDGETLRFPNAEHCFPQADFDDIASGEMFNADYARGLLAPVERAGKLRLVSGDVDLGDGLTLVHTPGESRGHQVVRLDAGDQRVYYLGDLVHLPIEVAQPRWPLTPRPDPVPEQLEHSRTRVFEDASTKPSTFLFTHGRFPGWGAVERAGSSWTWRYLDGS
jgi:glyoxylase-like metal-dependent hydrolase (beta-lactamase superfamily II)